MDELNKDLGENWEIRLNTLPGLLLIANAPVHLNEENGVKMTLAEFARGLEILQETAHNSFDSNVSQNAKIINVNTKSDLKLARQIFDK